MVRRLAFFSVACLASILAPFAPVACSSSNGNGDVVDAGPDSLLEDIPPFEEPAFESDDPFGRVILLKPYHPDQRCFESPTAIGHPDALPDGGIAPCGAAEKCYVRKDGVVVYAPKDCIHGSNFLFNVDVYPYSDLGPCEPIKHVELKIKDCPNASCTYARDVRIDTTRGCATAITSKSCRDEVSAPAACFCSPTATDDVFVTFDGKSSTAIPSGFTPCDATSSAACKKALTMVDTVKGCVDTATDAGADAADAG